MKGRPYLASEDSAFLRETLRLYHGETFLEIGAGNAGNLVDAAERFGVVLGTDLVRPSMEDWKGTNVNFVLADGASCLRESTFDMVAFNPPYLTNVGTGDIAVEGGEGLEVPERFLEGALRAVKREGRVLMLLNGDADLERFKLLCAQRRFGMRRLATRHLFFEELSVYEASGGSVPR